MIKKKQLKIPKIKHPNLSKLKKKAWNLFSEDFRKRNADKDGMVECYTCGCNRKWQGERMQAGHGISGRGWNVLFLENIIRVQCDTCNIWKGGNYQVFVPKLIREIGLDEYERIERESHLPDNTSSLAKISFLQDMINKLK